MLGEIGGTNQSKVLTNNFLLLLVALLFLALAFVLKLRGGNNGVDSTEAKLCCRPTSTEAEMQLGLTPPPGKAHDSPGEHPGFTDHKTFRCGILMSEEQMLK